MHYLFSIIIVLLGTHDVLGDIFPENSCTCLLGYERAKSPTMSVPDAFRKFQISPDFVRIPPEDELEGKFVTANVELGEFIEPLRAIDTASVMYPNGKKNVNYTMLFLDIDGPQGPAPNVYITAMSVNIPNSDNLYNSGDMAVPYIPPVPSLGSGVHRPTALLYEQNAYVNPDDIEILKLSKYRVTQLDEFVKNYNLNPVPMAGTFFRTELSRCKL